MATADTLEETIIIHTDKSMRSLHDLTIMNERLVKSLDKHKLDRKSTRLNSSHSRASRMPSSA